MRPRASQPTKSRRVTGFDSAPDTPIVPVFRRLVAGCQTHNQVLRALITLERRITPRERQDLIGEIRRHLQKSPWSVRMLLVLWDMLHATGSARFIRGDRLRRAGVEAAQRHWMRQLNGHARLARSEEVSDYRRVWSRQGKILFRRSGRQSDRLLIAFTDGSGRIMMSVADFLQALDVDDCDVLFLWPSRGGMFTAGIPQLGHDLASGLAGLRHFVASMGYTRQWVVGCSSGTIPAVLYGVESGADKVLLAGAISHAAEAVTVVRQRILQVTSSGQTLEGSRIAAVFGTQSEKDTAIAQRLSKEWGSLAFPIPNSGHVCLYAALERGELAPLLRTIFSP